MCLREAFMDSSEVGEHNAELIFFYFLELEIGYYPLHQVPLRRSECNIAW
jgi:hypothetical protein